MTLPVYLVKIVLIFEGHGSVVSPPSWVDEWGFYGVKPKANCDAGYNYVFYNDEKKIGWSCMWYSSNVTIPGELYK